MKDHLVKRMRDRDTDELVSIYTENDKQMWTDEAFKAMRTVLIERGVEVPLQREQRQEDKGDKHSSWKPYVLVIIFIGIGLLYWINIVAPSIMVVSMHIFVFIILTTEFIYCFKRQKSSVIWMLLMLPPILWVAHRFFPYTLGRGRVTGFQQFLVDTFNWSFSKALIWRYVVTFILCWTVVIILEMIVFKLLMWQNKSKNLDEEILICTDCKAEVSENDMICPKCGSNFDKIVE